MKAISEDERLPLTLTINDSLAHAYRFQNRHGEAFEKFKETYNLRLQKFGEDHPDTVASKHYRDETEASLAIPKAPTVNQPSDNQYLLELEELEREIDILKLESNTGHSDKSRIIKHI